MVGAEGTAGLLVVTDDVALRNALRDRGARTAGSAWLIGRLQRSKLSSPSVGNRRPPRGSVEEEERAGWAPGRGATTKKGNPRRGRPPSGRMPA
jgi:hypothetical protein